MKMRKIAVAVTAAWVLLSLASVKAFDFEPAGDEFQVNTQTQGVQNRPAMAMDANGNFVVVWSSVTIGNPPTNGVFAQRYQSDATPNGGEFKVNEFGANSSGDLSVAMDASGKFVIAWAMGQGHDGDGIGIFAKRYDAAGNELPPPLASQGNGTGNEFQVNNFVTGTQLRPNVAMDPSGNFVIVWEDFEGQDGDGSGIFAKRYDASGNELPPPPGVPNNGNEFQVNTFYIGDQYVPSVVIAPGGSFIITWFSRNQDGGFDGLFAKRYDAAGQELSPPWGTQGAGMENEFQVNSHLANFQHVQHEADVATDAQGNFVVTWAGDPGGQDGSSDGVFAKRYDAGGNEIAPPEAVQGGGVGNEFQVNTHTLNAQGLPSVGMDAEGNFVMAWVSHLQGPEIPIPRSIYAKAYDAGGNELMPSFDQGDGEGNEFRANTFTETLRHNKPRVAMAPSGNFVVAWENTDQDGDNAGVFARRFEVIALTPAEAIEDLIDQVDALEEGGTLDQKEANKLRKWLKKALKHLENNVKQTRHEVVKFTEEVMKFIEDGTLTPTVGDALIAAANAIIHQLDEMFPSAQAAGAQLAPQITKTTGQAEAVDAASLYLPFVFTD